MLDKFEQTTYLTGNKQLAHATLLLSVDTNICKKTIRCKTVALISTKVEDQFQKTGLINTVV